MTVWKSFNPPLGPAVMQIAWNWTATETYPNLVFFTLKKIKGFLTLIKNSMVSKKIKSFTLNNTILRLFTLKQN